MADIARGVLVGRLTKDPELNESGKVLSLSIAVNRRVKSRDSDEYVEEVSFFDVRVLGNRAQGLAGFLAKGRQVAVDARIVQERWENSEGEKRSAVRFIADEVTPLGSRDDAPQASEPTAPSESSGGGPAPNNEIPFGPSILQQLTRIRPRAAGVNLSVDDANGTNVAVAAAHSSLPRIDLIAETEGRARAIQGVPTAGATLDNLFGVPCLPAGHQQMAWILIPPAATTIGPQQIVTEEARQRSRERAETIDRRIGELEAEIARSR